VSEEQEMNPRPIDPPKVEVAPLQSKFLKWWWLLSVRDWTNEIIVIGLMILAGMDLAIAPEGQAQLAYAIGGGLVGYLVKSDNKIPEIS
jgi:hypothetical protein